MNTDLTPRIKSIFDDIVAKTPPVGPTPIDEIVIGGKTHGARSPWTVAAAAAIAIAGVGGALTLAHRSNQHAATPASQPSSPPVSPVLEPTSYPVLDEVPAGLSVSAAYNQSKQESVWTEALIGRLVEGTLTDTVAVMVQAEPFNESTQARTQTELFGSPATVYTETTGGTTFVEWGSGPYFRAYGSDPVAFLSRLAPDSLATRPGAGGSQPPTITFSNLPAGFAVIAPPATVGGIISTATLQVGSDNFDISVGTRNWVAAMAELGPLRSIEVGGHAAWTYLSSFPTQDITWQIDANTYVYLKVNDGTDATGALALANKLTFIDRNQWETRYQPRSAETPESVPPSAS
jgi:hypothetical protein